MNILKWFGFGSRHKKPEVNPSQETCTVCWGHQQYGGQIRVYQEDKQIDVKNHKRTYVRSQKLVKNNIDGNLMKKKEIKICPTCGSKHGLGRK